MDPLTGIGLLASIANLVLASKEVLELMRTFKDQEKELSELVSNISMFEAALTGFYRVLGNEKTTQSISEGTIQRAVDESLETLKDLKRRLTQIDKSDNSTFRRLKWVQHKSSLERIDDRIKFQCSMLQNFVSITHLETYMVTSIHTPEALEICMRVVKEMESESSLSENTSSISRPSSRKLSDVSTLVPKSSPRNSISSSQRKFDPTLNVPETSKVLHRHSISSAGSSIFSSNQSTLSSSTDASSYDECTGIQPEISQPEKLRASSADSLVIRRACRFDCYCKCHAQSIPVSNDVFSIFSAPIFRHDKGAQTQCTEPDCAGATVTQQRVVPSRFFRKTFSNLMSSRSIKVRYHLNTYRMVPEGSNAMRYVKQGNLEKLKISINSGETTQWDTAPDGWSLLHTAAYARQLPIVQYLLDVGADTEVADIGTRKPADLAILKFLGADSTHIEEGIVQIFSKKDDYISDFEFTPIHIAVLDLYDPTDPERPTLEEMIEFVDDANNAPPGTNWARWKIQFQKRSPLFMSIIEQFRVSAFENPKTPKVTHNLLDQKDRKFHWTPLHWATSTGKADKMKILIENDADPFIQSNLNANIVHAAVESDALDSLAYTIELCNKFPDELSINHPNIWGESPLIMAAQGCLLGCLRLLLEAGADRNVRQENKQVALHYAGLSQRSDARRETVALLCDGENETCLHVNAQDEDGRSPIFDFLDDTDCMEILINHGARFDLLDSSGQTLFHHACIQGETSALETLLQLCTRSTTIQTEKNNAHHTPLIEALRHGNVDCAMTLLKFGDVGDIVGQDGWAAIHYSTKLGDADLLEAVLKHPSFVKCTKTNDGKTARDVAMETGNWCGRVKVLLKKYNSRT